MNDIDYSYEVVTTMTMGGCIAVDTVLFATKDLKEAKAALAKYRDDGLKNTSLLETKESYDIERTTKRMDV